MSVWRKDNKYTNLPCISDTLMSVFWCSFVQIGSWTHHFTVMLHLSLYIAWNHIKHVAEKSNELLLLFNCLKKCFFFFLKFVVILKLNNRKRLMHKLQWILSSLTALSSWDSLTEEATAFKFVLFILALTPIYIYR